MNTLLKRIDTNNITNTDLTGFARAAKRMQDELDEAWDTVRQAMQEAEVTKMEGEGYRLSFVPRKTWKADGTVPPRYYKQVLDTTKLTALDKLGEKLPEGVSYTTAQVFRKEIK